MARGPGVLGDAASFYLPYLEDALAAEPDIRVIGLKRPREETVASFGRFLDEFNAFPTNHWAEEPAVGWLHDPLWTRCFPQYETANRNDGVRRYWDEYYRMLGELAERHPNHVRLFDMAEALNTEAGQRAVLDFAGFPAGEQVLAVGARLDRVKPKPARPQARPSSKHPLDRGKCAVLVPFSGFIHPGCERALQELERRGYPVRRVGGYAAIDQGRNQMATDALIDGFDETMWIDSDVEFHPDAVDQLRAARVADLLRGLSAEGAPGLGLPRPAGDATDDLRQGRRAERAAVRGGGVPARPPPRLPDGAAPPQSAGD